MRLVSFGPPGAEQPGALVDEERIVALAPLFARLGVEPLTMNAVLGLLPLVRALVEDELEHPRAVVPVAGTRLGPPVPRPGGVTMIGANYREHVAEAADFTNGAPPSQPVLVAKAPSAITGPYDDVVRPPETEQLDYEVELAVVIGRAGRRVPRTAALDHVAGYMVANDVSARDVLVGESARSPLYLQLLRGKGYDTFLPAGPWLVTADAVPDPQALGLRLWVNDELRQDGSTDQMIVDVAGAVASASEGMALRPGDVLLTGTPGGVAYGMPTPSYLEPGDVVRAEITGLGHLENRIVEEERACPTHSAGWRLSR